jgi:pseudouridine kinase
LATHVGVVGTVFVDCKGFANADYVPLGRNVGAVRFVHGGVGRNVAENIARLGLPVSLVSSVDRGSIGTDVAGRLGSAGVDTTFLVRQNERGMGMWLAVMDECGELAGSISQMPDLKGMADMIDQRGPDLMERSTHIALELDLNEAITKQVLRLAREKQRPVYGLPGNLEVILAAPEVLDGLACFICNHIEAGRLCKATFDEADPQGVLGRLPAFAQEHNLQSVVVTLGPQGCAYFDAISGASGVQPALKVGVVDTCGAGDAFFAGTMADLALGLSLPQSVVTGTRAAACTIQSEENSCLSLGEQMGMKKDLR